MTRTTYVNRLYERYPTVEDRSSGDYVKKRLLIKMCSEFNLLPGSRERMVSKLSNELGVDTKLTSGAVPKELLVAFFEEVDE